MNFKKGTMKKISIAAVLLFFAVNISAQTLSPRVTASGGGYATSAAASLSWTMGETNIKTLQSGATVLTQGFQQPELDDSASLNLKLFIQGYYVGTGRMKHVLFNQHVAGVTSTSNLVDTITVELHSNSTTH